MAFSKITENVEIHQTLPDNPSLTPAQLKAQWDAAARIIKERFNNLVDELNNNLYPIGTGFIAYNDKDYTNHLGFKWRKTLVGRTPVGKDTSQTEFNTVGKQGGSKAMQQHTHKLTSGAIVFNDGGTQNMSLIAGNRGIKYLDNIASIGNAGTGKAGNLQPYQVVNFWERIS